MKDERAVYLFYMTWAEGASAEAVSGGDEKLSLHAAGDVSAVVALVPMQEFCGPEAEERLKNLEWMSERALWHEKIVETGWRSRTVLPCRFGTLFSSFEALDRFIEANRPAIHDFLRQVDGHEEWALKMLVNRQAARRWLSSKQAMSALGAAGSPGLRYLQQRRAEAHVHRISRDWIARSCEEVVGSMDEYVTSRRQRESFDSATSDEGTEVAATIGLLIPEKRRKRLEAHIDAVNQERGEQGLTFLLSGPWPPYSFCPALRMPDQE